MEDWGPLIEETTYSEQVIHSFTGKETLSSAQTYGETAAFFAAAHPLKVLTGK
jgi:hypothetical protein